MHTYIIMMTAGVGYFLSVCFYLEAFCSDFALQMNKIDEMVDSRKGISYGRIESGIFQSIECHVKFIG